MPTPPAAGAWWWWPAGSHPDDGPVPFFPPAGAEQGIVRPLLEHAAGLRLGVRARPWGRRVRSGGQVRRSVRATR